MGLSGILTVQAICVFSCSCFFFSFFFLRRKKPMDTISNGDKVVLLLRGVRIRKLRFPLSQT